MLAVSGIFSAAGNAKNCLDHSSKKFEQISMLIHYIDKIFIQWDFWSGVFNFDFALPFGQINRDKMHGGFNKKCNKFSFLDFPLYQCPVQS